MPRDIFDRLVEGKNETFRMVVIQPESFKKLNALLLSTDKRTAVKIHECTKQHTLYSITEDHRMF
uniref:Uncharacterized protein n=1 Tax=Romanomermis culicivorax TaxID=13658 RepID=A0A915JWJ7_ROMCU